MSVLFHIATGWDWERAANTGTYTTESLHRDGSIGCSSAAQHAAVANHRFTSRIDLVLLLIDTDRLQSEVHLEQADADGQPVPRVDGPVNLDAVFEAAPYRPGADGRFHPHEEASAFATHGVATLDHIRRRALEVMAGYRRPWWVAGGWALDLLLGAKTRPHADLEISMLAADQQALLRHLHGWDLRLAAPGQSLPRWDGRRIQPPFHQVWARRGPGGPSTAARGCPAAAQPGRAGSGRLVPAGRPWRRPRPARAGGRRRGRRPRPADRGPAAARRRERAGPGHRGAARPSGRFWGVSVMAAP
jgi:uncharacterized protein (DUF952 family)